MFKIGENTWAKMIWKRFEYNEHFSNISDRDIYI